MPVSQVPHSHIDIISLHDAAEVLVGGEDPVETMVVDVGYNHLGGMKDEWRETQSGDLWKYYQPDIWQILEIIKYTN